MSIFHAQEETSYDSAVIYEIEQCLTNTLWNCTRYTSGGHEYDDKTEKYFINKPGETATMWRRRKNDIAALWMDFNSNSYYITVS